MFDNEAVKAVKRVAKQYGWPEAVLLAVVEVESNGRTYAMVNGKKEPLIRFEGHYFYRRLTGAQLEEAVKMGLASPIAGAVKNPAQQSSRWKMLEKAVRINKLAAYESVSWGVGQVMGAHWDWLGYKSIDAFVSEARSGVEGQVRIMAKFIQKSGLEDEMKRKDWAGFAKIYNGPSYAKNSYHIKLANAYQYWSQNDEAPPARTVSPTVEEIQIQLNAHGYAVKVDGAMGPQTREAIRKFQASKGLIVDGIVGVATWAELSQSPEEKKPDFVGVVIQFIAAIVKALFGKK
jgi:Putative peptidoglycan-binding domain-containing protein